MSQDSRENDRPEDWDIGDDIIDDEHLLDYHDHKESDRLQLITEKIAGCIHASCSESENTILWETFLSQRQFGSVSIVLERGCESMDVILNNKIIFSLKPGQTRSATLPLLEKLEIRSPGGNGFCRGKYCLTIHYFVAVPTLPNGKE